jgi:hypothetical protein
VLNWPDNPAFTIHNEAELTAFWEATRRLYNDVAKDYYATLAPQPEPAQEHPVKEYLK